MRRALAWWPCALMALCWLSPVAAEPPQTGAAKRLYFFDCSVIAFFDNACAPIPATAPTSPSTPPEATRPTQAAKEPHDQEAPSPAPAAEPLFTPETVSPETPPLLLRLMQEPTASNALAFLAWQRARLERIQQVEALLRELQSAQLNAPTQRSWRMEPQ